MKYRSLLLNFYCDIGTEWDQLTKQQLMQRFCDYLEQLKH